MGSSEIQRHFKKTKLLPLNVEMERVQESLPKSQEISWCSKPSLSKPICLYYSQLYVLFFFRALYFHKKPSWKRKRYFWSHWFRPSSWDLLLTSARTLSCLCVIKVHLVNSQCIGERTERSAWLLRGWGRLGGGPHLFISPPTCRIESQRREMEIGKR